MLLRLLLTLMLAMVAVPAAAAMPCHDSAAADTMTAAMAAGAMTGRHHRPAPMPDPATAAHFCVGCVPPSSLVGARLAAPALIPAAPPAARVARLDLGGGDPPSLPPPRRG